MTGSADASEYLSMTVLRALAVVCIAVIGFAATTRPTSTPATKQALQPVLPRTVGFARDGVLVGSPPSLLFCRDTDGDGKADVVQTVATDFGIVQNPENSANGLLYNLDNWIYCADYEKRIRLDRDGKFRFDAIPNLGQFGISRDDFGRLFFNTNSDYLRGSL